MSLPDGDPRLVDLEQSARSLSVADPAHMAVPMPITDQLSATLPNPFSSYDLGEETEIPMEYLAQPIVPSNIYSTLPSDQTLFSDSVLMHLIHTFFIEIAPTCYPNPIHQVTFMQRFPNHTPLLIYSMCAAAARRSDHLVTRAYVASRGVPFYLAGEPYFWKAREIINDFSERPNFETVLALVTLGQATAGMGDSEFFSWCIF